MRIELAIAVLLATAFFVALLVFWPGSTGVTSGRAARIGRMSALGARLFTSTMGARARRLFASEESRKRLDRAERAAAAKLVADEMGQMKGALMKLGQMLSFVSGDVPEEYRAALQSLQASAPPMSFRLIRDVIERELGMPLERAFASFDETPLAAASIGQVHRATLGSGQNVVVKVQYPGVADAIRSDLANATTLYSMVALMYPNLDPKPVIDELRDRVFEELDYELEADAQRSFHELYRDHPFIVIPRVIDSHSTKLVITSEFHAGRRFAEIVDLPDDERSRFGEIIYRFVFASIFRFGVFNGDPHPGNYLFTEEGTVVFLDFGCVKYFPPDVLARWKELVRAHFAGDHERFREHVQAFGFIADDSPLEAKLVFDYFSYFYEPFRIDRVYRFNQEHTSKSFRFVLKPTGEFEGMEKKFNMPKDFVFVNRIQWGVWSVLAALEAEANFHRIHRELVVADPPATDLGRLDGEHHRAWRVEHGFEAPGALLLRRGGVERAPEAGGE